MYPVRNMLFSTSNLIVFISIQIKDNKNKRTLKWLHNTVRCSEKDPAVFLSVCLKSTYSIISHKRKMLYYDFHLFNLNKMPWPLVRVRRDKDKLGMNSGKYDFSSHLVRNKMFTVFWFMNTKCIHCSLRITLCFKLISN